MGEHRGSERSHCWSLLAMPSASKASPDLVNMANRNAPQPAPPASCPSSVNGSTVPQLLKPYLWACLSLTLPHPQIWSTSPAHTASVHCHSPLLSPHREPHPITALHSSSTFCHQLFCLAALVLISSSPRWTGPGPAPELSLALHEFTGTSGWCCRPRTLLAPTFPGLPSDTPFTSVTPVQRSLTPGPGDTLLVSVTMEQCGKCCRQVS